ncbi:MAG TPA: Hsp20/alpha crystallin family protein [Syntrophaceae bacterium]|nr:Hsp20/alpha crystallin family protein [Syntrophaceae bacterium]
MFDLVPWRRTERDLLDVFRTDFDEIFNRFFVDLPRLRLFDRFYPYVDISETDKEVIVKAEIPGMDTEDIDITLRDGMLSIKGEKKQEKEEKDEHYQRIERYYGSFTRNLRLPCEVSENKAKAEYKDGVLTIKLPKTGKSREKHIKISAN